VATVGSFSARIAGVVFPGETLTSKDHGRLLAHVTAPPTYDAVVRAPTMLGSGICCGGTVSAPAP
jgi:hypothetical protein